MKFESSVDDDLCITDGTNDGLDYIPICLLCPLTRTRIEVSERDWGRDSECIVRLFRHAMGCNAMLYEVFS